jgi:hypothetical protein
MQGCADALDTGVLAAVVVAWGNNVAVELAADFYAIFFDGSLGANLHAAVFENFDTVNNDYFFESHFDLQSKPRFQ